jgi:hypothetical protein
MKISFGDLAARVFIAFAAGYLAVHCIVWAVR